MSPQTPSDPQSLTADGAGQVFDNPSDMKLILGFVAGLLASLIIGAAFALQIINGGWTFGSAAFCLVGFACLLPALFWSLFWRVIFALFAIAMGVYFGLQTKETFQLLDKPDAQVGWGVVLSSGFSAFLCVVFATFVSYWDIQDARRGRNFNAVFNGLATITLSLAAWGLVNVIAQQRTRTWDWTESRLYTLSEEAKTLAAGIKRPVVMHIFLPTDGEDYALIKRLADQYREIIGGRMTVKPHDPLRDRLDYEQELARLEIEGRDYQDLACVVFETGRYTERVDSRTGQATQEWTREATQQILLSEMFQARGQSGPVFIGEEKFTNALLALQGAEKAKIYIVQGFKGRDINDPRGRFGWGYLAGQIRKRFFEVEGLDLAGGVPEDCDALILPGLVEPLGEGPSKALEAYLKRGGRALIFLDVELSAEGLIRPSPLAEILASYDILASRHVIVGRRLVPVEQDGEVVMREVAGFDGLRFGGLDAEHPVVRPLQGTQIVTALARAIKLGAKHADVKKTVLIRPSDKIEAIKRPREFQRRNFVLDPKEDWRDGFVLGVACEREQGQAKTRLLVFGDADIGANLPITRGRNLELVLNSLSWLIESEDRFIGKAKEPPIYTLDISDEVKLVLILGALFLPILPLSLGFMMFLIRRR